MSWCKQIIGQLRSRNGVICEMRMAAQPYVIDFVSVVVILNLQSGWRKRKESNCSSCIYTVLQRNRRGTRALSIVHACTDSWSNWWIVCAALHCKTRTERIVSCAASPLELNEMSLSMTFQYETVLISTLEREYWCVFATASRRSRHVKSLLLGLFRLDWLWLPAGPASVCAVCQNNSLKGDDFTILHLTHWSLDRKPCKLDHLNTGCAVLSLSPPLQLRKEEVID